MVTASPVGAVVGVVDGAAVGSEDEAAAGPEAYRKTPASEGPASEAADAKVENCGGGDKYGLSRDSLLFGMWGCGGGGEGGGATRLLPALDKGIRKGGDRDNEPSEVVGAAAAVVTVVTEEVDVEGLQVEIPAGAEVVVAGAVGGPVPKSVAVEDPAKEPGDSV